VSYGAHPAALSKGPDQDRAADAAAAPVEATFSSTARSGAEQSKAVSQIGSVQPRGAEKEELPFVQHSGGKGAEEKETTSVEPRGADQEERQTKMTSLQPSGSEEEEVGSALVDMDGIPVHYFVMGHRPHWEGCLFWPPPGLAPEPARYFLHPGR
jgi:hypothetical protein